jgi:hypothetical protein
VIRRYRGIRLSERTLAVWARAETGLADRRLRVSLIGGTELRAAGKSPGEIAGEMRLSSAERARLRGCKIALSNARKEERRGLDVPYRLR